MGLFSKLKSVFSKQEEVKEIKDEIKEEIAENIQKQEETQEEVHEEQGEKVIEDEPTKTDIDEVIINYIKNGGRIPTAAKELVSLGLPSRDAIMRYYRDWHEPFIIYSKLYEKLN